MDIILNPQWVIPLLAAAAAWGGSRQALNGTRANVKEIKEDLKEHCRWEAEKYEGLTNRITAVEVKLERRYDGE